mmetsp:Transcript_11691/g.29789  ORF Transcript_11691/g.29789 Transcript_11691/m.29789 type:complete len:317 (-) Transcript_11691:450-1400(-)
MAEPLQASISRLSCPLFPSVAGLLLRCTRGGHVEVGEVEVGHPEREVVAPRGDKEVPRGPLGARGRPDVAAPRADALPGLYPVHPHAVVLVAAHHVAPIRREARLETAPVIRGALDVRPAGPIARLGAPSLLQVHRVHVAHEDAVALDANQPVPVAAEAHVPDRLGVAREDKVLHDGNLLKGGAVHGAAVAELAQVVKRDVARLLADRKARVLLVDGDARMRGRHLQGLPGRRLAQVPELQAPVDGGRKENVAHVRHAKVQHAAAVALEVPDVRVVVERMVSDGVELVCPEHTRSRVLRVLAAGVHHGVRVVGELD